MKQLKNLLSMALNPQGNPGSKPGESSQSKEIPGMYSNEKGFFQHAVPKLFTNASLETCDLQPPEYIEFSKHWALDPCSVFLCGGYGSGKTHFAFAMLREMFRRCPRKIWPRYFTSPELDAKLLRAVKSDEGDSFALRDLGEQDLLFIDDIGRETKSDRLKRQYFEILNYRYTQNLPTILSSNFSLEQLGDVLDGAIASRIQTWQIIEFNGPDLRRSRPMAQKRTETHQG
jgi:DNA replication protein DnaC